MALKRTLTIHIELTHDHAWTTRLNYTYETPAATSSYVYTEIVCVYVYLPRCENDEMCVCVCVYVYVVVWICVIRRRMVAEGVEVGSGEKEEAAVAFTARTVFVP